MNLFAFLRKEIARALLGGEVVFAVLLLDLFDQPAWGAFGGNHHRYAIINCKDSKGAPKLD